MGPGGGRQPDLVIHRWRSRWFGAVPRGSDVCALGRTRSPQWQPSTTSATSTSHPSSARTRWSSSGTSARPGIGVRRNPTGVARGSCPDGCCLSASGKASSGSATLWLRYLIRRHLFAHVLNGKVVGSRRSDRELLVIAVRDNRVRERVLHPGTNAREYAVAAASQRRTRAVRDNVIRLEARRRLRSPR